MRVNRAFLYGGVFLVAVGGVLVVADLAGGDTSRLAELLRLWPLALIAIGVAIVVRRSRAAFTAGLVAAALPGIVVGGGLAVGSRFADWCPGDAASGPTTAYDGAFDGPAEISLRLDCGAMRVATGPGTAWHLAAAGREPAITSSVRSLAIESRRRSETDGFDLTRTGWAVTLPTSALDTLAIELDAGQGDLALPGAQIRRLDLEANVGQVVVDASGADIREIDAEVNVGRLAIVLPTGDLTGSLRVHAGQLAICRPSGLGLRVTTTEEHDRLEIAGESFRGAAWQSADYASATHHADLHVEATLGSVTIDPIGGCK